MKYASPYTPGAGAMPRYLAGREEMLEAAEKVLEAVSKGYPQKSVMYYGLRGVGKTVLLNAIEENAEEKDILYTHIEIAEKKLHYPDSKCFQKDDSPYECDRVCKRSRT